MNITILDTAASRVYNITLPRSRPTALLPFWHVAGYALGAGTALLGKEAAMACTVAVEVGLYNDIKLTITSPATTFLLIF